MWWPACRAWLSTGADLKVVERAPVASCSVPRLLTSFRSSRPAILSSPHIPSGTPPSRCGHCAWRPLISLDCGERLLCLCSSLSYLFSPLLPKSCLKPVWLCLCSAHLLYVDLLCNQTISCRIEAPAHSSFLKGYTLHSYQPVLLEHLPHAQSYAWCLMKKSHHKHQPDKRHDHASVAESALRPK